jgi:hypothetical protein
MNVHANFLKCFFENDQIFFLKKILEMKDATRWKKLHANLMWV